LDNSLLDIYNGSDSVYREFCSISQECQTCEWLNVCGNGCALERYTMKGSFNVTDPECSLKKELFGYIKNKAGHLFE
jgi:radical SAM protein with 4Fe4S-binding SPASM domain